MHYRISVILAAVMALIGLAVPAFASTNVPSTTSCFIGQSYGPYHIVTNDNHQGITYHGTGNQVTVTSSPGDSTLEVASCLDGVPDAYVIHNDAGNCLRMHDKSSGYAVYEETNCNLTNTDEAFILFAGTANNCSSCRLLANVNFFQKYLGVICPPDSGDNIYGQDNASGNCINWILEPK